MRKMLKGDYYELHIKKPRILSRIEVVCKENSYPERFKLETRENDISPIWELVGEYDSKDGKAGKMEVLLYRPRKVIAMRLTVIEPRLEPESRYGPPAWSIYDIRLTEVRIFGRWWKRIIER